MTGSRRSAYEAELLAAPDIGACSVTCKANRAPSLVRIWVAVDSPTNPVRLTPAAGLARQGFSRFRGD
jgi:hypothetical protein